MSTNTTSCLGLENTLKTEIIPSADSRAIADFTRGGYDNKYRKLRGIGEYNATGFGEKRKCLQNSTVARTSDKRKQKDKGEYP